MMKAYPVYKDSGLPWVDKVPSHWETLPNIGLFDERIERGFVNDPLLSVTQDRGIIQQSELQEKKDSSNEDKSAYKKVKVGDIAYNKMRMWQGAVGHSPFEGIVSPAYIVLKPKRRLNPRFYHYLFRTPAYVKDSYRNSYGICDDQLSLRFFNFKRMGSLVPPVEEQDAIVAFLEGKQREMDAFIANKQRTIALLQEQKAALINSVVTEGLDPKVSRRSSNSAYWGDVPSHWRYVELQQITDSQRKIMYGIVLPGPHVEEGVYIVKGGNCEPGRLRAEFLSKTTHEIESGYARSRLKVGDIVYAIRGSIGAAEIVPEELEGANLTQDAARIAPNKDVCTQWLLYALRSQAFFTKLDSEAKGATIRGINIYDLKRGEIAVPPYAEQKQIANFLDSEIEQIQQSLSITVREIALMQEYRSALIAEAVTGRIDVRSVPKASLPAFNA